MTIEKEFVFDAAHFLPFVAPGHKCRGLHGHTYTVVIGIEGDVGPQGWIMDFADISAAIRPILKQLDHRLLNSVPGLENPTAENIAQWLYDKSKNKIHAVSYVIIQEGVASRVIYPRR